MDFFSNKREKICVFFKSRGVNVALFLLYLILYIEYPPLKKNIFSLKEKNKNP
jgi:hypothetical protein